ncbi:kinase-like domain-containing protein [Tricharina praecox]|uniref:kinase-like domain-containing protein n=1 Tax=Tricharina praecox TaxID=43433 RepID=UPI00221EAF72|nr:kinase-like domain-containing protein [Tricharina praecox]KAI5856910.1 kinase-like domain-containing protein [Tricharina praecox]
MAAHYRKHIAPIATFRDVRSQVGLLHRSGNRRIWGLGSEVVCRERPITAVETPNDEFAILEFLRENTRIPVQRGLHEWLDKESQVHFSLKTKIPGESLESLWPTLTWREKERMADETAKYLKELRGLTSNYYGRVKESGNVDTLMFNYPQPKPQGPFATQDELWNAMVATLKGQIPRKALSRLRAQMPECLPWTYTHGDLGFGNIIVRNGHVVGILDWEWSGYFPCWWEYVKFRAGLSIWIDREWWDLLEYRLEKHQDAYEFYDKFHSLVWKVESATRSIDPTKVKIGNAVLEELLEDENGVSLE